LGRVPEDIHKVKNPEDPVFRNKEINQTQGDANASQNNEIPALHPRHKKQGEGHNRQKKHG
jgi:hypothetical protein